MATSKSQARVPQPASEMNDHFPDVGTGLEEKTWGEFPPADFRTWLAQVLDKHQRAAQFRSEEQHSALVRVLNESRQSIKELVSLTKESRGNHTTRATLNAMVNSSSPRSYPLEPSRAVTASANAVEIVKKEDEHESEDGWPSPQAPRITNTTNGDMFVSALSTDRAGSVASQRTEMQSRPSRGSRSSKISILLSDDIPQEQEVSALEAWVVGPFDLIMGGIIVLNAIVMCFQLQYEGHKAAQKMGIEIDILGNWNGGEVTFKVIEHIFNVVFILELTLRIYVLRIRYFKEKSNYLDLFIVLASVTDSYILEYLNASQGNLSFARVVRLLRLVRGLRIIRTMTLFRQLRVLVNVVASSFAALFWAMVLLAVIMIMSAIVLCQLLSSEFEEMGDSIPDEEFQFKMWVYHHYGTFTRSFNTMFSVTMSGCWPNYAEPLYDNVHWLYVVFFQFYVILVVFSIIRVISALFLQETLRVAELDTNMVVQENMRQKAAHEERIRKLFYELDLSGDGVISEKEFSEVMNNQEMKAYLQILGLDVCEAVTLFCLLDDGDGEITYEEFLSGVMRLRGQARTQDVVTILHDIRKVHEMLRIVLDRLDGTYRGARSSRASRRSNVS